QHLERGDWISALRECGSLLEEVLRELYDRTASHLSNAAKTTILNWERRTRRNITNCTLGNFTDVLKSARVLSQAQSDFGRPLPFLLGADWQALVSLRNKASHAGATVSRAEAHFFAAYVAAFLEELGWENFGYDPAAASATFHPFDLFKEFGL